MILAINANAAIDRVMFIDRFTPGQTMRPQISIDCVGGKGADAALVLAVLGAPHLLISFMAGETGRQLEQLYHKHNICSELLWVPGELRFSHVLVETEYHRHSHITTRGYSVTDEECSRFLKILAARISPGDWTLIAGSLPEGAPADFYCQAIDITHRRNAKALIDCAGKPLVEAIPSRPDVIKINRLEFMTTFGLAPADLAGLASCARSVLLEYDLPAMVITLAEEGMLAVTRTDACFARGLNLNVVNAAGAGDAASASITYRLSLGDNWLSTLQWGSAAAAATVIAPGTAECSLQDILDFKSQVEVEPLSLKETQSPPG